MICVPPSLILALLCGACFTHGQILLPGEHEEVRSDEQRDLRETALRFSGIYAERSRRIANAVLLMTAFSPVPKEERTPEHSKSIAVSVKNWACRADQLQLRYLVVLDDHVAERFLLEHNMLSVVVLSMSSFRTEGVATVLEVILKLLGVGLTVWHTSSTTSFFQDPARFLHLHQKQCAIRIVESVNEMTNFLVFSPMARPFLESVVASVPLIGPKQSDVLHLKTAISSQDEYTLAELFPGISVPNTSVCILPGNLFVGHHRVTSFDGYGLRQLVFKLPPEHTLPVTVDMAQQPNNYDVAFSNAASMGAAVFFDLDIFLCRNFRPVRMKAFVPLFD